MGLLGFLKRLVVVTRHRIRQVGIHIGVLWQDRHEREALVAGRAERPEALDVRNCHNPQFITPHPGSQRASRHAVFQNMYS